MTFEIGSGVSAVLWACEKAEFACADLYHHFAALFKDDREVFQLWLKAAMEEENRARLFALMAKLRHDNVIAAVELELTEAEQTLQQLRSLLLQAKDNPPTLKEALEMGMELEAKLGRQMRENVVKFADETYENSFLAMTSSKHLEALQDASRRLEEQRL